MKPRQQQWYYEVTSHSVHSHIGIQACAVHFRTGEPHNYHDYVLGAAETDDDVETLKHLRREKTLLDLTGSTTVIDSGGWFRRSSLHVTAQRNLTDPDRWYGLRITDIEVTKQNAKTMAKIARAGADGPTAIIALLKAKQIRRVTIDARLHASEAVLSKEERHLIDVETALDAWASERGGGAR